MTWVLMGSVESFFRFVLSVSSVKIRGGFFSVCLGWSLWERFLILVGVGDVAGDWRAEPPGSIAFGSHDAAARVVAVVHDAEKRHDHCEHDALLDSDGDDEDGGDRCQGKFAGTLLADVSQAAQIDHVDCD